MKKMQTNDFRLKLREGAIKDYEKVILSQVNDIFMPMGFVSSSDGELVTYNCSGYTALRQCRVTEVMEALEILERTLILVSRAGEYLFYDRKTKQVKIAYVPLEENASTLRENMFEFITEMEAGVTGTGRTYLQDVKSEMEENNYYIQDLINVIGDIRRTAASKKVELEEVFG